MNVAKLIREFCVRKLARILYDCVECSVSDRALIDWLTAEDFVNKNPQAVTAIWRRFIVATIVLSQDSFYEVILPFNGKCFHLRIRADCSYESFDRICGKAVWDSVFQPWQILCLRHPYTKVRF